MLDNHDINVGDIVLLHHRDFQREGVGLVVEILNRDAPNSLPRFKCPSALVYWSGIRYTSHHMMTDLEVLK